MLPVQEFLRARSAADLLATHGVHLSPSSDGQVVAVSYDQLAAKKSDPLTHSCRGLILHILNGFRGPQEAIGDTVILSRPFDRFFNLGEGPEELRVNLSDPRTVFEEKLDGTFVDVYHDPFLGSWQMGTRNVPRGDAQVNRLFGDMTYRGLFEKTVGGDLHTWASARPLCPEFTYMFELTTPANELYVRQDQYQVTLIGVRHTQTGREVDPQVVAPDLGLKSAKVHRFPSVEETLAWTHSRPPRDHEGLVAKLEVSPGVYLRSKVKNVAYVAAAHASDNIKASSTRSLMTLILTGNFEDVAPTLNTEIAARGRELESHLAEYCRRQDEGYLSLVTPGMDRKEVARVCGSAGLNVPACFARYEGKVDGFSGWIEGQKGRNGRTGWPDSLLDTLAGVK